MSLSCVHTHGDGSDLPLRPVCHLNPRVLITLRVSGGPSTASGEGGPAPGSDLPVVLQEAHFRAVCFPEGALGVLVPVDVVYSVRFVVVPVGQSHPRVFGEDAQKQYTGGPDAALHSVPHKGVGVGRGRRFSDCAGWITLGKLEPKSPSH